MVMIAHTMRKLWQNVRHDHRSIAFNVLVLTLSFFTVVVVGVAVSNVGRLTRSLEDRYEVTVYLRDGISADRVAQVKGGLERVPGVRGVTHLDPGAFRSRFLGVAGSDVEGLGDIALDVFPAVLEVQLAPDFRDVLDPATFAARVSRIDAVESVETHEGWLKQIKGLVGVLGLAAVVFGLCVLVSSVFMVANTVKLAFLRRQRVVEIMKLFGATRGIIVAPVLLEGFLQSAVGALIAALLARVLVAAVDSRIGAILGSAPWHVAFVPASWLVLFVLVCGAVGVLGAHMASARTLRV